MSRFSTTAQVLRLLGSGEPGPLDGNIELLRSVFRISARAGEAYRFARAVERACLRRDNRRHRRLICADSQKRFVTCRASA